MAMRAVRPGLTLIAGLRPVKLTGLAVSNAVSVWLPAAYKVALKVPDPEINVMLAGSLALESLLVKWTVPLYPLRSPLGSTASTVSIITAPAVVEVGGAGSEFKVGKV